MDYSYKINSYSNYTFLLWCMFQKIVFQEISCFIRITKQYFLGIHFLFQLIFKLLHFIKVLTKYLIVDHFQHFTQQKDMKMRIPTMSLILNYKQEIKKKTLWHLSLSIEIWWMNTKVSTVSLKFHSFSFLECHELMNNSNSKYDFQNMFYFAAGIYNNPKTVA